MGVGVGVGVGVHAWIGERVECVTVVGWGCMGETCIICCSSSSLVGA